MSKTPTSHSEILHVCSTGFRCLVERKARRYVAYDVRILFFERYSRTLTYSILAYVNKNRIREWQWPEVLTPRCDS